jgi:hypothetical protein
MLYAHVTDGTIRQLGPLPRSWRLVSGEWMSNFPEAAPAIHDAEGWWPVVYGTVAPPEGQSHIGWDYTVGAGTVAAAATYADTPPEPLSLDDIVGRLAEADRPVHVEQ